MRLFIAVPLPKNVQRTVFSVQEELRLGATAGRFVPAGNHHITVRFLGESNALADLAFAMHDAVKDAHPFTLRLGGLGSFTHSGSKTCFLHVNGETQELFRIHETLEAALLDRGFVRGRGKPEPHITLARAVEYPEGLRLSVPNESFRVGSIVLYESTNRGGRMVYTPLHTETF
ncbi:MAG: RNA 2',3'-cyclic phosphodiesterase [Clostridia bacterium]|jgi:2'-5' RNA ligase|nr:RNA 2',3'-cyclic phosphodiesterase [Clostridia bacterium]